MNNIVNPTFSRSTDADFENKCVNVVVQLADNTIFSTPYPEFAAFEAAVKTFSETLALAADRGRTAVSRKNAARKVVEKHLVKVANFVALVAGDDLSIVIKVGFKTKKPRQPRPAITAPENLQTESGNNPGEILISVSPVKGAKTYLFEYTTDPLSENSTWKTEPDSRSEHLIAGLKPGQKYWFRVAAVGLRGIKMYSIVISCFIQ